MTRYNHMTTLNYTGTVQTFTVPTTGKWSITAAGASGGQIDSTVSRGALVSKTYDLQANSKLLVVVGAQPKSTGTFRQSGGGGGSFVYRDSVSRENVLVVGGGGGGSAAFYLGSVMAGGNGLSEPGSGGGGTGADHGKHSGHPATPGSAGNNYNGGGGGGPIPSGTPYYLNPVPSNPGAFCGVGGGGGGMGIGYAGASFSGGRSQSHTCTSQSLAGQDGGYGGGGSSGIGWNYTGGGGGGGGYTGGNGGVGARLDSDAWPPGGNSGTGGGSFPSGAYIGTNNVGHGYVKIEFVAPSTTAAPTSSPISAATPAPTTQAPTPAPTLAPTSAAPTTTSPSPSPSPSPSSASMVPPAYLRYPPNFVILVHEGEWMNSGALKVMTLRGSTPSLQNFVYKDLTQIFAIDSNGSVRTVSAQGEYLNHATNCDGVIGGSSASQWQFVPRNLPRSYALEVVCSSTLGTKRIDYNPINSPWGPYLSASTGASTGWFIVPVARIEST